MPVASCAAMLPSLKELARKPPPSAAALGTDLAASVAAMGVLMLAEEAAAAAAVVVVGLLPCQSLLQNELGPAGTALLDASEAWQGHMAAGLKGSQCTETRGCARNPLTHCQRVSRSMGRGRHEGQALPCVLREQACVLGGDTTGLMTRFILPQIEQVS